jgi:hypothetical protein
MIKINEEFIKRLISAGKKEEEIINFIVANRELITDKIRLVRDLLDKVEGLLGEEQGKEASINVSITIINKEIKGELSNLVKLLEEEKSGVVTEGEAVATAPETVTPPSSETAPAPEKAEETKVPDLVPEQVADQIK